MNYEWACEKNLQLEQCQLFHTFHDDDDGCYISLFASRPFFSSYSSTDWVEERDID